MKKQAFSIIQTFILFSFYSEYVSLMLGIIVRFKQADEQFFQ